MNRSRPLGSKLRHSPTDPQEHASRAGADRHIVAFLSYYRPHLPILAADLACAILVAATALSLPICASLIARRLGTQPQPTPSDLIQLGALMLTFVGLNTACRLFVDYQGHMMGAKMEGAVRKALFDHCQRLSFSFYDRQRVGQLMSRITTDSLALGELFHHGPEDAAIAVLKFCGAAAILIFIDGPLALVVIGLTPMAALYALYFNRRMNVALAASRAHIGSINERVEDALAGIRVVQSFANEREESQRFQTENRRFLDSRRAGYRSEAFFHGGMNAFAQLATVLVVLYGAMRVAGGHMLVADLLAALLCVGVLIDPVQRLANIARLWQEGYSGFARVQEILETAPDVIERPRARPLRRARGAITFENVSFGYQASGPEVLARLNLRIQPGEFVALVGPSGTGKTTLCSLIPRFYDVTAGRVTLDGIDVRDLRLTDLRRNVGVVQQDLYLFAGTVEENIRYGRQAASEADVVRAAQAAHAHDFILSLPEGYCTDIGQRGVKLSGGQKQRLTIARAFLKDPPVLIFDEATSALDSESERAVQLALSTLARDRTTLVIAHRLSTVRKADRILVLGDGGIVEEGPHEALIKADGAYSRLYNVQASI